MKRKVVQIAGFTKVISLPAEWVKKLNIKKGDELEIKEGDSTLTILAPKQKTFRKAHIDASKLNPIIIWPTLSLLHKTGYEEIKISGIDKEIMKIVYEKVQSSLFGFEVIEQTDEYCIIKNMSEGVPNNLQTVMRKIFLVMLSQARQSLEFVKKNDPHYLEEVLNLEATNDRLTNYSERILNEGDINSKNRYEYFIIWLLENLGDGFKNLCSATNTKIKASAAVIETFEEVNSLLERLQSLFYKFTLEDLSDFSLKLQMTNSKINRLLRSNKGTDVTILANLLYITRTIHDFVGATIYLKADLDSNIETE